MPKLLIVEDDKDTNRILMQMLSVIPEYEVVSAYSGSEALLQLEQQAFDLILLDLMLPGLSGEEVLERSQAKHHGGVIVLSARSELEDKVQLLHLGADDYLTKPFHQQELKARIESVLRRYQKNTATPTKMLTYQALQVNPNEHTATIHHQTLKLTNTEFDILMLLLEHPHQVFTREQIYQHIWGDQHYVEDNAINVHVSNLRKKIATLDDTHPYIETVWGIGFKLA
ncbi:MAG: response regulator transcription factor [Aerococcus sp.]|nr:response regulator transcription factor [Aerococcus sp.]